MSKSKFKLAAHNAGTGEEPKNIFAKLGKLICKCQDKTLIELAKAGVKLFDLRVRYVKDNYYIAHGLGVYNKTLVGAIMDIWGGSRPNSAVIMVTYEGNTPPKTFEEDIKGALDVVNNQVGLYQIAIKLPQWNVIYHNSKPLPDGYKTNYVKVVGCKALFPFPKFWDKRIDKSILRCDNNLVMEDFI